MLAQSPDKIGPNKIGPNKIGGKIGPKFFLRGDAPNPKEFMKYVQYYHNQSPQTNNLPLGD